MNACLRLVSIGGENFFVPTRNTNHGISSPNQPMTDFDSAQFDILVPVLH
jgi:hypothetical protein